MPSIATLGFRVHSGWAALVALAGPAASPTMLNRARIQLSNPDEPGPFQPYHTAADLTLEQAEDFLKDCSAGAATHARRSLGDVLHKLRERDCDVRGCGILFGSGRQPGSLAQILSSHAMIHSAEGDFFREVLAGACEHHGITVTRVKERDLWTVAESSTRIMTKELEQHLGAMGKSVGPPWRQDQKYAALAAWIALSTGSRGKLET